MIEKKTIAKQILLSTISANPLGSFIVRTFDQFSSITKDAQIEKKLDFLFDEIIKLKGQNIGNILINYSSNIDLQSKTSFRKMEATLLLVRIINTRSQYGREWDPEIKVSEILTLFEHSSSKESERTMRMCVHELNQNNLIYKLKDPASKYGYSSIGPNENFFYLTDDLFQEWSPKEDAKIALTLANKKQNRSILCKEVMDQNDWSIRRMNSILKFMEKDGLIFNLTPIGGENLWDYYFRPTDEADFFLDRD